jgi:hypothetical protein
VNLAVLYCYRILPAVCIPWLELPGIPPAVLNEFATDAVLDARSRFEATTVYLVCLHMAAKVLDHPTHRDSLSASLGEAARLARLTREVPAPRVPGEEGHFSDLCRQLVMVGVVNTMEWETLCAGALGWRLLPKSHAASLAQIS